MRNKTFIVLGSILYLVGCGNTNSEVKVVTAAEMQTNLKFQNVQVIDVRPDKEYKESHLFNAKNIIYDKNFRKNLEKLDKNKPVAIYCTTGTISPEAAEILKEAGFKNIYLLEGGIKKWISEKQDVNQK